jgi:hypothetical protein
MTELVPPEHRLWQRKIVLGVVVVGLLMVAGVVAALLRTHDHDITVYSESPDGKLQVIGLRDRTYLLDYGGERDIVLFRTTFSTGEVTYGRKEDVYPGYRRQNHERQKEKTAADHP